MATFTAANASVSVNMVDFFRFAPPLPLTIDFITFNLALTTAEVEAFGGGAPGGDLVLSYVGSGFSESAIVPTGGTFTSVTLKEAGIEIGTISGITRTGNFAEIVTNDAYRILIGNDFITGSEQGDTLFTGDGGNDTVFGGSGNDTIFMTAVSGAPTHSIDGGIGNDTISLINNFYSAAKTLDLRSATVQSIEGFDFVDAGLTVILNSSQLKAASFSPSSTIDGTGVFHVVMNTGSALDLSQLTVASTVSAVVDGTSGADLIFGSQVADTLRAGAGADRVDGNGGDDIFEVKGAEAEHDAMSGGPGHNTLRVTGTADVTLNNFDATGQSLERWAGNGHGLVGNDDVNHFDLAGLTSMTGLASINGGAGNDTITGSKFADVFAASGTEAQFDTMNGGLGIDTFRIVGGADVVLTGFNATAQSIEKWVGNGHGVLGNGAANTFDFGGLTSVSGLAFVDGADGNDVMTGSAFRDVFRGGDGNDAMNGGSGNDLLAGGLGTDHLSGGLGPDVFDFDAKAEIGKKTGLRDIVVDFTAGEDQLDFSTIDANGSKKGDKAFKFLKHEGSEFTHKAGQLIWEQVNKTGTANDVTLIKGDVDGNGKSDFQLELTGLIDLHKADLVL